MLTARKYSSSWNWYMKNKVNSSLKFATIYILGNVNTVTVFIVKCLILALLATSNLHNTCFNLSVRILTISSFVYGAKWRSRGLKSSRGCRRGNILSVRSNAFAIPIITNFEFGAEGHSNIVYKTDCFRLSSWSISSSTNKLKEKTFTCRKRMDLCFF